MFDEVLSLLAYLNNTMSKLKLSVDQFPIHRRQHAPLQELYEDYLGFCLKAIRYLTWKSISRLAEV